MSNVDHPEYYKAGGIEAIDVIEDWKLDFCLGNAIKYIARAGKKSDDVKTDLKKALWYIKRHKRGVEQGTIEEIQPKEPTKFSLSRLAKAWGLNFLSWLALRNIYGVLRDKKSGATYVDSMNCAIECLKFYINCLSQREGNYKNYLDFILEKMDERTLLEQLAEEASELSQAALKLIRAKGLSENATPKTEDDSIKNIAEEMMDCTMVMNLLGCKDKKIKTAVFDGWNIEESPKWKRWAERLGYKGKLK